MSCPETVPTNSQDPVSIPVEWTSPEKTSVVDITFANFKRFCLHGNNTEKVVD